MVRSPSRQRPRKNRPGRPEETSERVVVTARSNGSETPDSAAPDVVPGSVEVEVPALPKGPSFKFSIGRVKPIGTRHINMMVYGPYGHGKTFFAGTAVDEPTMQDVLFIAAEPGDMSLTSRKHLDIININKYDQVADIYRYLIYHCKWRNEGNVERMLEAEIELKQEIVPLDEQTGEPEEGRTWFEEQRLRTGRAMDEPYQYRTVIIDSLSEVHKYLIYKYTGVDIGKTKLNEEIERMEEWQSAQELFRLFIRSFRDLDMNVIFVSAEAIEPAERNKRKNPLAGQSLPKLAGQMAGDVAGFIDIVGYMIRDIGKDGEATRYLYLGAGYEGWISKHRFENLPDLESISAPANIGPTLSDLLDLARKDAEAHGNPISGAQEARLDKPSSSHKPSRPDSANRRSRTGPKGSRTGRGRAHAVR